MDEYIISACLVCKIAEVRDLNEPAPDLSCDCGEIKVMYQLSKDANA